MTESPATQKPESYKAVVVRHTAAFKAKKFLQHAFAECRERDYAVVAGINIFQWREGGLTSKELALAWEFIKEAHEQNIEGVLPSAFVPPKYFSEWPVEAFA